MKIAKSTKKFMKGSNFWLDESMYDYNTKSVEGKDYLMLSGYRRAITNFVKILTGKDIPVQFATKGNSYTDGERITISGNVDKKGKFDEVVGLALHEASHILLSDFGLLKDLRKLLNDRLTTSQCQHLRSIGLQNRYLPDDMIDKVKTIINVIEDRRIDAYVYRTAPGYQSYYKALYDAYFNSTVIDKALRSNQYRTEDWDSYMFRFINIANSNQDLDALRFLRPIIEMVDLKNISRLQSTKDVLDLAYEIYWIIEYATHRPENAIPKSSIEPKSESQLTDNNDWQQTDSSKSGIEKAIQNLLEDENDADSSDMNGDGVPMSDMNGENDDAGSDEILANAPMPGNGADLTEREQHSLTKDIESQRAFINGDIKKTRLSEKDNRTVKALSQDGTSVEDAQYLHRSGSVKPVKVIVIRNLNKFIIQSGTYANMFRSTANDTWAQKHVNSNLEHITKGLALGAKMAKKLKVRNEVRDTKFTRLRNGMIDKRLLSSLGYGAESIFHKMEQFQFKPMYFHLSLDASGSMSGERFNNCMRLATAIANAARLIGNIRVVIDIRGTWTNNAPVVAVIYDSKHNNMQDLIYNLSHVTCDSVTPEGLCFEAITKDIVRNAQHTDAIFFNFSDGEPICGEYVGDEAINHTAMQVRRIAKQNIQILSYFISDYHNDRTIQRFKTMYGAHAQIIDTQSIVALADTINHRLLTA